VALACESVFFIYFLLRIYGGEIKKCKKSEMRENLQNPDHIRDCCHGQVQRVHWQSLIFLGLFPHDYGDQFKVMCIPRGMKLIHKYCTIGISEAFLIPYSESSSKQYSVIYGHE
jgi:hypothetical protein